MNILRDILLILVISLPILFLFRYIKLPSIVGFIIAGALIGPGGLGLISKSEQIEDMAEIGVILLLFTVGLEFSLREIAKLKRFFFLAGGLQLVITAIVCAALFYFAGIAFNQSLFYGILISLSSTAIALKLFQEKNELETPQGKISVGILIFQDLAVVVIILLLPFLAPNGAANHHASSINLFISFGILAVIGLAAYYIMPKFIFYLAKIRTSEAFTIGIILIIFGAAYLTGQAGLSLALGAFIAGLLLADSDYNYQVIADVIPFKNAFNSIFFVSIGMLFDFSFFLTHTSELIALSLGIMAVKTLIIFLIVAAMRFPARIGLVTGLTLSQVGEFSFVLAQSGMGLNLISEIHYNAFLAASVITMLATPVIGRLAPYLGLRLNGALPERKKGEIAGLSGHVVIVGFGVNGRNLARALKETGIGYVTLELNPATVKECKSKGERIVYGDAAKRETLKSVGIRKAKIIVFAISDSSTAAAGIKLARELNPTIYIIARTRLVADMPAMIKAGADIAIPEEFETSLQIFNKVLTKYHIPLNIIMRQTNIMRGENYSLLISESIAERTLSQLDKILAEGLVEPYFVEEGNKYSGKTLKELNLRAVTGAAVISIIREGKNINNPSGDEVILSGDSVVFYGTHNAVDKAFDLLNG
jgi:CPA2 family monovalent cation:H+ antiporter-2